MQGRSSNTAWSGTSEPIEAPIFAARFIIQEGDVADRPSDREDVFGNVSVFRSFVAISILLFDLACVDAW